MDRTLVIGGTLFIGRALVERLLERGDEVVIMHRGSGTPFADRVEQLRCDRNDVEAVARVLAGQRFDVVYDNVFDWQRGTTAEQVTAAARAAHAANDSLRRYVFTSSVAAYPIGGPYDEGAPLTPDSDPNDYARLKAQSERALFALHRDTGLGVATLRPAFIYGPNNPFNREAFFWDRIRAGRPIVIPGDGSRTMQWVHVGDVARAAILAAAPDAPNASGWNLGSTPPISHTAFVELLARVAGRRATLVHVPREQIERMGGVIMGQPLYFGEYLDIPSISMRGDRLLTQLGLALTSLEDGLQQTYRWYEQQVRPAPDYTWEDTLLAEVGG